MSAWRGRLARTERYRIHRDEEPATECRCGKVVSKRYDYTGAVAHLERHARPDFDDPESLNLDRHEGGE